MPCNDVANANPKRHYKGCHYPDCNCHFGYQEPEGPEHCPQRQTFSNCTEQCDCEKQEDCQHSKQYYLRKK